MYINNQYERRGEIDLRELFCIEEVTDIVIAKQDKVKENLARLNDILKQDEPNIKIGTQCHNPFECSFSQYCFKDVPEISIFNLYRINQSKAYNLYHQGIISYEDILNSHIPLTQTQKAQISTPKEMPHIDKNIIKEFISQVKYPIHFLDFETFQEAIPRFDHQKPYAQITFQYSLHMLHQDDRLEHFEFLGDGAHDPRENLAKVMILHIKNHGSIMAYNMSFERSRIKELSELFPYDKTLSYHELPTQNGGDASSEYANLLYQADPQKTQEIKKDLLRYCHLDTLAMVEIFKKLRNI